MLSFSVVGCGAAGNKAVIDLMEIGYAANKCYLINSTNKDIPERYHDNLILFGQGENRLGGCGKERSIGKEMLLADLKSGNVNVDNIVDPNDQAIILVSSTEGGSGSSSIPILAKYFKEVHNANVIVVLFFGFGDDSRGLKNTVEIMKELSSQYTVACISNARFTDKVGNKFKAEQAANQLFLTLVKICTGSVIRPGTQMIDDTDLFKCVTTPGYMIANTFNFRRPKSAEEFDTNLNKFLRDQEFVDPGKNPGCKRIAAIFNVPEVDDNIDFHGEQLKKMYGEPFEFYTHMSDGADTASTKQSESYSMSYIISGMDLPIEDVERVYEEYQQRTEQVNKSSDQFFAAMQNMQLENEDTSFNMLTPKAKPSHNTAKSSFFDSFGKQEDKKDEPSPPFHQNAGDGTTLEERKANFDY